MIDFFLLGILPYIAIAVAIGGAIWRYATNQFSYSSISSQFLEGRQLFWGSVPWHWGIITILIGHLIGIFFPSAVKAFNGEPVRLYILEGTAFALGLLLMVGLILLIVRRGVSPRVRAVTSPLDVTILVLLLLQAVTGLGIAIFYRWGSAWFVQTVTPYLWSLATFSPRIEHIVDLPLLTKIHAVNAVVIVGIFPFTRLVHLVSIPIGYLWRPYQIARWYRRQPQA